MKYKLIFTLVAMALTVCSGRKQINPVSIIVEQAEIQNENDLQELINAKHSDAPIIEVPASSFTDMDYLFLAREIMGPFSELRTPWYEYALLGGSYDTYEKGINCYNKVNQPYEKWLIGRDFNRLRELYGEGYMNHYYRRHIIAFSPDGERVLLKTYLNPDNGLNILYETGGHWGSMSPYIYSDTIVPDRINYTKGLQFATLDPVGYSEDQYTFYRISGVSDYYAAQDEKPYDISTITDADDTLYYKKDVDPQGRKCIGIYSIPDNRLVFRSKAIEAYPVTVDILDHALIGGFKEQSDSYYLKYIEIDMNTNEADYLFTGPRGSFSPDGMYFACPAETKEYQGYHIYSVAANERAFIKSYGTDTRMPDYFGGNYVCCWVSKDKIEEQVKLK